jgi:hypothetical protein
VRIYVGDSARPWGIASGGVVLRGRQPAPAAARYNSAVRHALTFVVAAAVTIGCGAPPDPKHPTGPGSTGGGGGTGGGGTAKRGGGGGTGAGGASDPKPKDIACLVPSCVYHAGVNAYFACQSGGAGTCFHYGPACTPAAACMYDAAARSYKQCTKVSEGTCGAWGAACAPESRCMFNPADGMHHACDDVSGGTCKRYGALCAP